LFYTRRAAPTLVTVTDAELVVRLRANIVAFKQFQADHGFLRSMPLPGVWAFAQPDHPRLLGQQQVFFEDPATLEAALPALEDFYRRLGVRLWQVWVPPGTSAAEALSRAGLRAESSTPAMGLGLGDVPLTPPGIPLEQLPSQAELIPLNAEAFGPKSGIELQAWHSQPYAQVHVLGVHEGGRLVVGGMAHNVADTAGIYLVATALSARRRGLATEVMRGLLVHARERGCTAAVLQSTVLGHGVYQRLGFRDLGRWVNWVRRLD
jgi:GNAT superfamily N-acetyltransferase